MWNIADDLNWTEKFIRDLLELADDEESLIELAVIEAGRVYVHYGTYGTACIDTRSGKIVWTRRNLIPSHCGRKASWFGTSRVLYGTRGPIVPGSCASRRISSYCSWSKAYRQVDKASGVGDQTWGGRKTPDLVAWAAGILPG